MSYIIPDARPIYNKIVDNIVKDGFSIEARKYLVNYLKSVNPIACDAQFSYFLTTVFVKYEGFKKAIDLPFFRQFILDAIKEVYSESFGNYARASGMLYLTMREYKMRYGKAAFLVENFMIILLEQFYDQVAYIYQTQKRRENGDII